MSWTLLRDGAPVDALPADSHLLPAELDAFRLRIPGEDIRVPPLDELDIYDALPEVPDATVEIHYEVTATPVGTIRVLLVLEDGRMVRAEAVDEFVESERASLWVSIDWARHLEWRAGGGSVLEAIEGAPIEGRWQVMLLVHGLLQQREWRDALRRRPRVDP